VNWLKSIWAELMGLFVDDGSFALSIVVWLIACGLVLRRLSLPSVAPPAILFVGLALILARSAVRRAGERP
jgi:xanthosine utilization system XapX-like protein